VTKDEEGLATVIGHEVSHAIARHGGERVSEGMLVNLGLEAVAAGMSARDPQTVQTVTGLLGAGATVGVLMPFSRDQESEADRMGLVYMAKAGYRPDAALAFWKRMQQASPGAPPQLLSDHPSDATRIQQIEGWLPEARAAFVPASAAPTTPLPAAPPPARAPAPSSPAPAAAPPVSASSAPPAPPAPPPGRPKKN